MGSLCCGRGYTAAMRRQRLSVWCRRVCTAVCVGLAVACVFGSLWELRWSSGTNAWVNVGYGAVGAGRVDAAQYDRMYPDGRWRTDPRGLTLQFTGVYLVELWPAYEETALRTIGWP